MEPLPCKQCGNCCRVFGCPQLDEKTNLCKIYDERPGFCNAQTMFDKLWSKSMSWEKYIEKTKNACKVINGRLHREG